MNTRKIPPLEHVLTKPRMQLGQYFPMLTPHAHSHSICVRAPARTNPRPPAPSASTLKTHACRPCDCVVNAMLTLGFHPARNANSSNRGDTKMSPASLITCTCVVPGQTTGGFVVLTQFAGGRFCFLAIVYFSKKSHLPHSSGYTGRVTHPVTRNPPALPECPIDQWFTLFRSEHAFAILAVAPEKITYKLASESRMIPATERLSKVCSCCGRELSIANFRLRKRGESGRQGCCRECYNGRMRAYRLTRRSKAIRGFASQVLRATGPQAISRLCAAMFRRFGGTEGFCRAWMAHLDAAPAGSREALTALSAILRLMETADAQKPPADYSGLTDAELDQELQRLLGDRDVFS